MRQSSGSLIGSSKTAHRRNLRAERRRLMGLQLRLALRRFQRVLEGIFALLLLWTLPLLYLAASYLTLDLPARWLSHRPAYGAFGLVLWLASVVLSGVGLGRAVTGAAPVVPVRPKFARWMLFLGWLAALAATLADR